MKTKTILGSLILAGMVGAGPAAAWEGKASQVGDMLYKATGSSSGWVGHAGVLYQSGATRLVADVTDGRGVRALSTDRSIGSFENDGYWGARRFMNQRTHGLSSAQKTSLLARIAYLKSSKVEYDHNHLDQKGTWFPHNYWWQSGSHWEFDCVGFVERIMEDIGLNPTYGSYESGTGWPLTPSEQKDSSYLTPAPSLLSRTVRNCSNGSAVAATQKISLINGSYSNYTCANRYQEQCIDDGSFDQYYDESCAD